jgi:ketosteroid isomerase-like protein
MSKEDVDFIRQTFRQWNEGDRESFIDLERVSSEVELSTPITRMQGRWFQGIEGIREWLREIDEQFSAWKLSGDEWRDLGDRVLVLGSVRLRGRGSGLEMDQDLGWVYTFRDGKLWRFEAFADHAEAEQAAKAPVEASD